MRLLWKLEQLLVNPSQASDRGILLHEARVNDVVDTVNSDGRLSNVGGHNHLQANPLQVISLALQTTKPT